MEFKDIKDVKHNAYRLVGENYYDEFKELESDVNFFNLYMQRNRKSKGFYFTARVNFMGSRNAFNDIWETYAFSETYLEDAFACFHILKALIFDISENVEGDNINGKIFKFDEMREFVDWFKRNFELDAADYVGDFVGIGCCEEIARVKRFIQNFKNIC